MINKKNISVTLGLMFLVNLVFADMPGGGVKWPAQSIRFSNISSLDDFVLHVKYNYDYNDEIITRDRTIIIPEHRGAPGPRMKSFFALSNKISTDTIEITETDKEIHFTGIKHNKLQFSRKTNKGNLSTLGSIDNNDNDDFGIQHIAFIGINSLLLWLSFLAIVGLLFLFRYYKKAWLFTQL